MNEIMYQIKTKEGTLRGIKHIPDEIKDIVIMYHGFTGTSIEPNYLFTYLARGLAMNNHLVLRMDYLGCGNSDGYFKDQTFTKFLNQARLMYEMMKEEYPDHKISILGLSMGGAICSELTKELEDLDKVILLSPAINMNKDTEEWFKDAPRIDHYIDVGGMLMDEAFLTDLTPYTFDAVQNSEVQVLVFAPTADTVVPYHYVEGYMKVYKNIDFVPIKDGDHVFTNYKHRKIIEKKAIDFLK